MKNNAAGLCDNQTYGYYKPDPGNGLNPLEIRAKTAEKWIVFAPEKLGGLQLDLDPDDFMTIAEMEASSIALVWNRDDELQLKKLEERIRSMAAMQRHLLAQIASLQVQTPTVVVSMDGSAVHDVRSSGPVRVILLDSDVDGADGERVCTINGEDVYVHDHDISVDTPDQFDQVSVDAVAQAVTDAFASN